MAHLELAHPDIIKMAVIVVMTKPKSKNARRSVMGRALNSNDFEREQHQLFNSLLFGSSQYTAVIMGNPQMS
jgi:hypothetical protein